MATPVVANTTGASIKKKKSLTAYEQIALVRGQLDPSTLGPASDYNSRDASRILATQYTGSSSGSAREARSLTNPYEVQDAKAKAAKAAKKRKDDADRARVEDEQRSTMGRTPTRTAVTLPSFYEFYGRTFKGAFSPGQMSALENAWNQGSTFVEKQTLVNDMLGTPLFQQINASGGTVPLEGVPIDGGERVVGGDDFRTGDEPGPEDVEFGLEGDKVDHTLTDPLEQEFGKNIGDADLAALRSIRQVLASGDVTTATLIMGNLVDGDIRTAIGNEIAGVRVETGQGTGIGEVGVRPLDPADIPAHLRPMSAVERIDFLRTDLRRLLDGPGMTPDGEFTEAGLARIAEIRSELETMEGLDPSSRAELMDMVLRLEAGPPVDEPFESSKALEDRLAGTQTVEPIDDDTTERFESPKDLETRLAEKQTVASSFGANLQEISDKLARGEKLTDQEFAMLSPEMQERVPQKLRPDYTAPTEDELWNEWTATQGAALQGLTGAQISAVRNGFRSGGAEGAAEMLGLVGTGVLDDTSGVAPEDPPPVDPPPEELSPEELSPEEIIEQEQEDTLGSIISDFLPDPIDEDAPEDKIYDPTGVLQGKIDAGEELTWEEIGALDPDARIEYLRDNFGEPDSGVLGEIRDKLSEIVAETGFDADEELQRRNERTAARFTSAREKLARQFGIDPGGPKTGRAARAFEQLSIAELAEVSETESEIARMAEEVRQTTLVNLTNSLAAIGGLDLETAKFGQTKEEFDQVMDLELKKHGLNDSQIQAVIRQIDASIDLDRDIFDQRVSEELRRFGLDERQIDETIRQMSLQGRLATKASNLESRKFNQSIKEQLRRYELDEKQITAIIENLTAESTLDEEKFKQQKTEELRRYGLDKKQIDEIVRQMGIEGRLAMKASNLESRKFNQTTKEFTETLELELKKFGLSDQQVQATIRQIDADIANSTRATSAEIGQRWADILGFAGTETGEVNADMLGVDLSALPPNLPGYLSIATPTASVVKASFESMMGRAPTGAELASILEGQSVTTDGVPTLESRQLASDISQQEMERSAKYSQLANELDLDVNKFTRATEEADRQWNTLTGNVAEEFGLENGPYQAAKYSLDNQINQLFFDPNLTPAERTSETIRLTSDAAQAAYPDDVDKQNRFIQASERFDNMFGDSLRAQAAAQGMEADTFNRAYRQAQEQEDRLLQTWASILSDEAAQKAVSLSIDDASDVWNEFFTVSTKYEIMGRGDGVETAARYMDQASSQEIDSLRRRIEHDFNIIIDDRNLERTIASMVDANASGEEFRLYGLNPTWFANVNQEKVQAVMSLLNSPIQVAGGGGGTWWEQLISSSTQIATAAIMGG